MIFLVAVLAGLLFGGADQYLGSLVTLGPWTVSVSQMSAPWLILPFGFGCTQTRPGRAALVALTATAAALTGYFAMTLSPVEGVALNSAQAFVPGLIGSNTENIISGAITAPLCGLLGQRARSGRWWPGAALVAGALCLEPLARQAADRLYPPRYVWEGEVIAGLAVAVWAVVTAVATRRPRAT
ncbi:MAG TPA: hypothetical protein VGL44_07650 [Gaiellales bacterium]|jgi:hypothetical protein